MARFDIVLLTASEYLDPVQPDWYVQQILTEDQILIDAFERQGLHAQRAAWSDQYYDWSSAGAAVFRAVWDYANRFGEFSLWLDTVNSQTTLINPHSIIRWNLDKHYLKDLSEKGIPVPRTIYIEKGEQARLDDIIRHYHLDECILKPAISAGARHTYKCTAGNVQDHEDVFRRLIAREALMIQPFLSSVTTTGEKTLVVIGGKVTHAVIKKTRPGDFRVQDEFGGTVQPYTPAPEEIEFAERAVAACDPLPLYGRVDILQDNDGNPVVSELELIEPELWFRFHPHAADIFASVLKSIL